MNKKKLKRYRLKINPDKGSTVDFISQVESPAIEVGFLKFNEEQLKIRPGSSETEQEWVSRCIPFHIGEGYEQKQAAAMCYSMWERRNQTAAEGNMDVFGYSTQYFEMCPGAQATFSDLVTKSINEETVGMIRSAAQIADNVFRIEKSVIDSNSATSQQMNEVLLLVSDFKDVMDEISEDLNEEFDVSYMDGHIETISSYLGENLKDFVDACWEGYEPVGFKIKDGQRVPNCVPIKQEKIQFATNDDKQELFGPVLIPDLPIYRHSESMGEYEIIFKKEDIKEIAMNFMKSGYQNNVNVDHSEKSADSYVFESFVSSELVPNPKPFQDLPLGTWFVGMKVEDKNIWNDIKEGKRKGFSIEGIFEYMVEEFEQSFKKQELKTTNKLSENEKLNLEKMIKDLFKRIFTELSQELEEKALDLSDYQMVASSDYKIEARQVGQKVEVVDSMGNLAPAPDGAYEFEDGFKFEVKDGMISSIEGVEETPMSEADAEAPVEAKKDMKKSYMEILADYPWDQCIMDMKDQGYTEEQANKICGSIRWNNMEDEQNQLEQQMKEVEELKAQIDELKKSLPTKEEIEGQINEVKAEFKSVFEKFSQVPAETSKVNKSQIAKDIERQKFEQFINTIRKK